MKETSIPMKKIGLATQGDNTYLEGRHVIETQVPYLIGTASFDIEGCINKFDCDSLTNALKQFEKGTRQEYYMFKTLESNFPK